jgi:hypothetical protein
MPVTADLSLPLTTPLNLQITSKDCAKQTAAKLEMVNDLDLNMNMLLDKLALSRCLSCVDSTTWSLFRVVKRSV